MSLNSILCIKTYSIIVIIQLMRSVMVWPMVIPLSQVHCITYTLSFGLSLAVTFSNFAYIPFHSWFNVLFRLQNYLKIKNKITVNITQLMIAFVINLRVLMNSNQFISRHNYNYNQYKNLFSFLPLVTVSTIRNNFF